ncbi:MAG: O-antigen ligase family protein [Elusimicrobiota bacterium]
MYPRIDKKKYTDVVFILLIIYGVSTSLSIAVTNIILGLLILIVLINFVLGKKFFSTWEGLPLLYLYFWRALRVFFNLSNWVKYGGKFWAHLPYFIIPQLNVKKIKIIIYSTLSVASFIAILGILQYIFNFNYPFLKNQPFVNCRFIGLNFRNALHTGGYYSIIATVSFVFFCCSKENTKIKICLFILTLINFVAIGLNYSRTYYVAILATGLLILLREKIKWLIFGTGLVFLLFIGIFKYSYTLKNKVTSIFDTKENLSNVMRLWMWGTALKIMKEHPIIGVGYGNWEKEVKIYFENEKEQYPLLWIISRSYKVGRSEKGILNVFKSHPHNTYLNVGVSEGLIGLILFVLFWFGNSIMAFKRARMTEKGSTTYALNLAVGYSIIMLMIAGFFENNLTTARILLPITFLMGLSYTDTDKYRDNEIMEKKRKMTIER